MGNDCCTIDALPPISVERLKELSLNKGFCYFKNPELPQNIIKMILDFLPFSDLISASRTCKMFYIISGDQELLNKFNKRSKSSLHVGIIGKDYQNSYSYSNENHLPMNINLGNASYDHVTEQKCLVKQNTPFFTMDVFRRTETSQFYQQKVESLKNSKYNKKSQDADNNSYKTPRFKASFNKENNN